MISSAELIAVFIVALLLFGPDRIPELARSVGKALGDFKKAQLAAELDVTDFARGNRKDKCSYLDIRIRTIAEDAGIETDGKTAEEIMDMLSETIKENGSETTQ